MWSHVFLEHSVFKLFFFYYFCRAVLCKRGLCRHVVSVCLSVRPSRSWTLLKRINVSSKFVHHRVATPYKFFHTKRCGNILTRTPLTGAPSVGGIGKTGDYQPISGSIACCERSTASSDGPRQVDDNSRW